MIDQRNPILSRVKLAILAMMAFSMVSTLHADDTIKAPSRAQKRVGKLVADLMERGHLSRRELDVEISERAFDLYMKMLDPTKSYFLQSDADEFATEKTFIAEKVKKGNYDFGIRIYKTIPRASH